MNGRINRVMRNFRKAIALLSLLVAFAVTGYSQQAQATASPTPTPSPIAETDKNGGMTITITMTPVTSTLPAPTPSSLSGDTAATPAQAGESKAPEKTGASADAPVPVSSRCLFTGGLRFVSRYHGGNGQVFRPSFDQNLWGEGQCSVGKGWSAYVGGWAAFQFKEIDANIGVRYAGEKFNLDAQYQMIYLLSGDVLVHDLNIEVSAPLFKGERFSVTPFGRLENYWTQKQDNLAGGTYLITGLYTKTVLGRGWDLGIVPKVLFDLNGAFGAPKGTVGFANFEVTKKFNWVTMGPSVKVSAGTGRPNLATYAWSFYF